MTPEQYLAHACASKDWAWVFHHMMSGADKQAFDAWIVATQHPSAFDPGTTEYRFRRLVEERSRA